MVTAALEQPGGEVYYAAHLTDGETEAGQSFGHICQGTQLKSEVGLGPRSSQALGPNLGTTPPASLAGCNAASVLMGSQRAGGIIFSAGLTELLPTQNVWGFP